MHQQTPSGPKRAIGVSAKPRKAAFATTRAGQLTTSCSCSEPGTLTIGLDGELDLATAPALERLLREVERDRWPTVDLDLRQLSFIDSSGIRALLIANDRIGRRSGRMLVRHPSRAVRRPLAAIGADSILDVADGVDEPTPVDMSPRPHPHLHGL
jgi:anti-sigma B factor antagonist